MAFTAEWRSMKNQDEWYTPRHAVEVILPYLREHSRIWCPFDKGDSEYVSVLTEGGHEVLRSHIDDGKDFFLYEPEKEYDCIISNPPYSKKDAIYRRLLEIGKPFAMLVSVNGLWDSKERFRLFKQYGIELLILEGRTKFIDSQGARNSPPFQSVYVCHGLLPKQICYEGELYLYQKKLF